MTFCRRSQVCPCHEDTVGIAVLGESVETETELRMLKGAGIRLIQGYYFARPIMETFQTMAELTQKAG